jgi:hypothetical protein
MRTITTVVAAATLAFAAAGATGAIALAEPPAPAPGPPPGAPVNAIDKDGTFAVNTQLAPGTYSTAGPVGDGVCYWKRTDATGATLDNAMSKKPQIVAITPTDASFKTDGCQPWTLTDAAPPSPGNPQLNGLKMQGYLALINGMAGLSGAPPPDAPVPAPAPSGPPPGPVPEGPPPGPVPPG